VQPINLLPDLRIRRRERLQQTLPRLLAMAAMIWLTTLASLYGGAYWHQTRLQGRLRATNAQIQALEPMAQRVAERQRLTQSIGELRELIAANTQGLVVPMLDLVASLLPAEISVQQFALDQGRLSLACRSSELVSVGQFYTNLRSTQQFDDIQFTTIHSLDRGGYAFTVTLTVRGGR